MSAPATSLIKRRFKWVLAVLGFSLLGLLVGLAIYLNSDSFRERVRARVVAQLERMTGGRVELDSFSWKLSQLRFEARGLTIHGLESPAEIPYVHVDRVAVQLKIISLLERKISLHEVITDRLTVHLMLEPAVTT